MTKRFVTSTNRRGLPSCRGAALLVLGLLIVIVMRCPIVPALQGDGARPFGWHGIVAIGYLLRIGAVIQVKPSSALKTYVKGETTRLFLSPSVFRIYEDRVKLENENSRGAYVYSQIQRLVQH